MFTTVTLVRERWNSSKYRRRGFRDADRALPQQVGPDARHHAPCPCAGTARRLPTGPVTVKGKTAGWLLLLAGDLSLPIGCG